MNILVCVKQVPEPDQIALTDHGNGGVDLDEFTAFRMNRFDEFAVEAAVCIKEAGPPAHIDALTVGPEDALAAVKRAVGMGADRGVHLTALDAEASRPATVAGRIADYALEKEYDLILTGGMSEDGMNGQVGPMIAAYLGRPCATQVISLILCADRTAVSIQREVEGGARERLRLRMPAVLSLQSGINRPRYPSLSNLLRANRLAVETVAAGNPERHADPVSFLGAVLPPRNRAGRVLEGTAGDKARQLLAILREKAFLIE